MRTKESRAFYVIGTYTDTPWVLTNERAHTLAECRASIRWQGEGGSTATDWAIAYWDAAAQTFREHEGERTFEVDRGPYTVKAFEEFMAGLPKSVEA